MTTATAQPTVSVRLHDFTREMVQVALTTKSIAEIDAILEQLEVDRDEALASMNGVFGSRRDAIQDEIEAIDFKAERWQAHRRVKAQQV